MNETIVWRKPKASVKTPTPTAPTPARRTGIMRIGCLNARRRSQDVARECRVRGRLGEVVVKRAGPHAGGSDEGWDYKGPIALEGLEPVASQKLLLDEGAGQLRPFAETSAMVEEASEERLAIEWGDLDRVALVEQEDDLAMDLSHEELVGRGARQHREVGEEELA